LVVRDRLPKSASGVALYARVSSIDQKSDLERQMERLQDYAAAHGYQVTRMVQEIGSGLNDRRPKFLKLLTDPSIGVIILHHRDRGTRFGFIYLEQLLAMQGRRLEVVFPKDTADDLVNDGRRASSPVWRRGSTGDGTAEENPSSFRALTASYGSLSRKPNETALFLNGTGTGRTVSTP
jgi:hypothetical protein